MSQPLTLKCRGRLLRALRPVVPTYPSIAALARAMGVSPRTLSDVLTGYALPGPKVAAGAAKVLGISVGKLVESVTELRSANSTL